MHRAPFHPAGSSIAAAVIRLDQRVMSLDNTVKALTTTVMENTEAHKAVKETISGNSDAVSLPTSWPTLMAFLRLEGSHPARTTPPP